MIEVKVSVPEIRNYLKEIVEVPGKVFDVVRFNVQQSVGKYLNHLMNAELALFLGRGRYERPSTEDNNYRNGNYTRRFTIKGIGEVSVKVPRDRNGKYRTQVIPKSRQCEDRIREDLCLMYLSGVSTRTLSLITKRLVGRRLSHEEVSKANGVFQRVLRNGEIGIFPKSL